MLDNLKYTKGQVVYNHYRPYLSHSGHFEFSVLRGMFLVMLFLESSKAVWACCGKKEDCCCCSKVCQSKDQMICLCFVYSTSIMNDATTIIAASANYLMTYHCAFYCLNVSNNVALFIRVFS